MLGVDHRDEGCQGRGWTVGSDVETEDGIPGLKTRDHCGDGGCNGVRIPTIVE